MRIIFFFIFFFIYFFLFWVFFFVWSNKYDDLKCHSFFSLRPGAMCLCRQSLLTQVSKIFFFQTFMC